MVKPKFVYWRAASRAQSSMLMFHVTNKEYEWDSDTANKWPESKSLMPFGQLPVFYDEDENVIPVEINDLPVILPEAKEFMPTGQSPLTLDENFLWHNHPSMRDN